jgi:hypothetical protein
METKIKHYVCPVCSGKSTTAQQLQKLDPENILLIEVYDGTDLDVIREKFIPDCKFKTIIIDNFLKLYRNKKNCVRKFINFLKKKNVEEIILFSTPDRLYDISMDKKEIKRKFLDSSEVEVLQKEFYGGLSVNDRMVFTSTLSPAEFETKILGVLYSHQNKYVMS